MCGLNGVGFVVGRLTGGPEAHNKRMRDVFVLCPSRRKSVPICLRNASRRDKTHFAFAVTRKAVGLAMQTQTKHQGMERVTALELV